jgi:hypothetical protein
MKTSLSIFLASTALTVALVMPALAMMQSQGKAGFCSGDTCAVMGGESQEAMPISRVSDNDDKGDDGDRISSRRDDDDCDEDDNGDDDDDCTGAGATGNPAPAGTVAPPANGLFGNGTPPVAVTN